MRTDEGDANISITDFKAVGVLRILHGLNHVEIDLLQFRILIRGAQALGKILARGLKRGKFRRGQLLRIALGIVITGNSLVALILAAESVAGIHARLDDSAVGLLGLIASALGEIAL